MGLTVWLALSFAFLKPQMTEKFDFNRIEEVRVTNNHRIPAESIRYQLQTKAGDRFNLKTIDADIRRLYATETSRISGWIRSSGTLEGSLSSRFRRRRRS